MTEQFTVYGSLRYGPAIYSDVFAVFAVRKLVDDLRQDLFPTPLSPVTSTEMSVGATRIAFSKATFNMGLLPIIPNLCLIVCRESIF